METVNILITNFVVMYKPNAARISISTIQAPDQESADFNNRAKTSSSKRTTSATRIFHDVDKSRHMMKQLHLVSQLV